MKDIKHKIFKTPFSKQYWILAANELKSTRTIALASILIAMTLILEVLSKAINFPLLDRQIHFTFITIALSSMLFGPIVALFTSTICDILGFFIFSQGYPFFPGYTLSAILGAIIFSLFLYRTRITLTKIFISKFIINVFVNAVLGALWLSILLTKNTYWFYLVTGLYKNLILLPFEVLIMFYIFKKIIPISKANGIISYEIPDEIYLI